MKTLFLFVAIALSFAACGQQEKTDDPFGKDGSGQGDGKDPIDRSTFLRRCNQLGELDPTETICVVKKFSREYTDDRLPPVKDRKRVQDELGDSIQKTLEMGSVQAGSSLFGELTGGQPVKFYLNNNPVTTMGQGALAPMRVGPGELKMTIYRGTYERLNVYVTSCFSQASATAECPR